MVEEMPMWQLIIEIKGKHSFPYRERQKTRKSVENVVGRIPEEELEKLLRRMSYLFAPAPDVLGSVSPGPFIMPGS